MTASARRSSGRYRRRSTWRDTSATGGPTRRNVAIFADDGEGGRETYTYWRLRNAANATANALRERGVERGDRVAINLRQRPETVVAHLACWKLGAVSVPLSTLFGTEAVSYRLNDADAVACFVDDSNADTLRDVAGDVPSLETVITVGDVEPEGDELTFRRGRLGIRGRSRRSRRPPRTTPSSSTRPERPVIPRASGTHTGCSRKPPAKHHRVL